MRHKERSIAVLDIGTDSIKVLLGSLNDTASEEKPFFELHGSVHPADGISKKGVVHAKKMLAHSIQQALDSLLTLSGHEISSLHVIYTHPNTRFFKKRVGIRSVRVPGGIYLTEKWLATLKERMLARLTRQYRQERCTYFDLVSIVADGEEIVHDPHEHAVTRSLRVEYAYALTPAIFVETVTEVVEWVTGMQSIQPAVVTNGFLVTDEQKEQGIIFCDIGAEFTNVTAYQHGSLVAARVLPFGGATITNDLALLKRVPVREAEHMKRTIADDDSPLKKRDVQALDRKVSGHLKEHLLPLIKALDPKKQFPGGVMLSGGGALYPGMEAIGEKVTGLHTFHAPVSWHVQSQHRGQQGIWRSAHSLLRATALFEMHATVVPGQRARTSLWRKIVHLLHAVSKILR